MKLLRALIMQPFKLAKSIYESRAIDLLSIVDLALRILVIGIFYGFFSWYFCSNADFTLAVKIWIVFVFSTPLIIYGLNLLYYLKRKTVKHNKGRKDYIIRNRYFVSFLATLIFYVSSIAGFAIFNTKSTDFLIQKLKPGAIGVRSWYAMVSIDSIYVAYIDSNNFWRRVPDEVIWKEENWIGGIMHKNNNLDPILAPKKYDFNAERKMITLANCAAVFSPQDDEYHAVYENYKISVRITFDTLYGKEDKYPGFHILSFVDTLTAKQMRNNDSIEFPELFLQYNFNYFDRASPWIPELNWAPTVVNSSSKRELQRHGKFLPKLNLKMPYLLSAIALNNQVLFLGHAPKPDIKTVTLFESRIEGSPY
jgi:hypothetical protein